MNLARKENIDRIIEIISFIRSQVEISNSLNLTDINVIAENFYRDLLNLTYGYDLKNINIEDQNTAAIDLGDSTNKIAIQVTSTGDLPKTRKTVKKFVEKGLDTKYDVLQILNIAKKTKHRDEWVGEDGGYKLNTKKDIVDTFDLVRDIQDRQPEDIQKIRDFLDGEVRSQTNLSLPREIRTFNTLIETLSADHPSAGTGFIEDPDPRGKIEQRFADHSEYLKGEFQDLFSEYGQVLAEVRQNSEIGQTRLRRLSLHLKQHSDQVLTEHNGNAKAALAALIDDMEHKISINGSDYDRIAIKFFLLDELIRCNIFPNKELIRA